MAFSQKLINQIAKNNLEIQEAVYLALLKGGFTEHDAYIFAYKPVDTSHKSVKVKCLAINRKSSVARIIGKIEAEREKISNMRAKLNKARTKTALPDDIEEVRDMTKDKSVMLEVAQDMYEREDDTKRKLDIMKFISDIQQMKRKEEEVEEDVIHYYLPLSCHVCPLYKKNKKKG